MLEERFAEIYTKFKMSLYAKVFKQLDDSYDGLSAVEEYSEAVKYAHGRPTIKEFASFSKQSTPNAAYKINNLIRKGYIIKEQSAED